MRVMCMHNTVKLYRHNYIICYSSSILCKLCVLQYIVTVVIVWLDDWSTILKVQHHKVNVMKILCY